MTHTVDHRRATAERNVAAILDATERLLAQRSQLSVSAVAGEAGVSRVTVYAHFKMLSDIVEAVVERSIERTRQVIAAAELDRGPATEALQRLLGTSWQVLDRLGAIAQGAGEHVPADRLRTAHEPLLAFLEGLVDRGRDAGEFRTDLPAAWLVTAFYALLHAASDDVRAERLPADEALGILTQTICDLFARRAG